MPHPARPCALALILALAIPALAAVEAGKPGKPAPLLVVVDFEDTRPGAIPKGFTSTGAVAVAGDAAHAGRQALRMEAAVNGPRRITLADKAVMAALGGQHWGRLFFRVQLPVPAPQGAGDFPVIHSTLVAGAAQSPLFQDPIEVRVLDTVLGPKGAFQYIYNVQPRKRPEFAVGSAFTHQYTDRWTLAEWYLDHATQTYRLYIDGEEIAKAGFSKGAGGFAGAEIPAVFESLSFGWNNYQPAGQGFVAWIDDIALSRDRVGTRGLPPPPKGK